MMNELWGLVTDNDRTAHNNEPRLVNKRLVSVFSLLINRFRESVLARLDFMTFYLFSAQLFFRVLAKTDDAFAQNGSPLAASA